MELIVQILTGLEVTWKIGNNTFKSLIIAKTMYEILRSTTGIYFCTAAFSSLDPWSSMSFQYIKSYYVCRRYESLSWAQKYYKSFCHSEWRLKEF